MSGGGAWIPCNAAHGRGRHVGLARGSPRLPARLLRRGRRRGPPRHTGRPRSRDAGPPRGAGGHGGPGVAVGRRSPRLPPLAAGSQARRPNRRVHGSVSGRARTLGRATAQGTPPTQQHQPARLLRRAPPPSRAGTDRDGARCRSRSRRLLEGHGAGRPIAARLPGARRRGPGRNPGDQALDRRRSGRRGAGALRGAFRGAARAPRPHGHRWLHQQRRAEAPLAHPPDRLHV